MSFSQFPNGLYGRILETSTAVAEQLGGVQLDASMDLKYLIQTLIMVGAAGGSEQLRIHLYGNARLEGTPIASSDWRDLSDFAASNRIGTLRFDFAETVPMNSEVTYYLGIETASYTKTPTFYLAAIMDWGDDVYTAADSDIRGSQMRFIGYREVEMGQVKRLQVAEGATITAPTDLSFGVGGALVADWTSPDGTGAAAMQENGQTVYQFPDAGDVELHMFLKVPEDYQAGNQITLTIGLYSPSASGTVKMKATTYLIRDNTDAVSSTTNSYPSTNAAITNASANRLRKTTLDLTSSTGTVNSVAVSAGDRLHVVLTRDYTNDTDTGTPRVLQSAEAAYV